MSQIGDAIDILRTSWRGRMRDVCLVDAFRSMGLKVAYESNGPFCAIADGRRILSSIGLLDCITTESRTITR